MRYLRKTLQDAFVIWVTLSSGVIIASVLYACLSVAGITERVSLLVSLVLLVGLFVSIELGRSRIVSASSAAFGIQQRALTSYKILVLGLAHSGKTSFLASMYYKLSTLNPETGFFLVTDEDTPEQVSSLRKYQEQVTNRAGTDFLTVPQLKDLKEWKFICETKGIDNRIYPLKRITYYDYAGERVESFYDAQRSTPEFRNILKKADVFLAMLDGEEILKMMRGEENNFEEGFVNNILPILTTSMQPVHFVITKWDLLHDQYSLIAVLSCLMKSKRFHDFVNFQRNLRTLRLIPVSAVGLGYAEHGPNGQMVKKPNFTFEPYQVEMPLVSVIFDQLNNASKKEGFAHQTWLKWLLSPTFSLFAFSISIDIPAFFSAVINPRKKATTKQVIVSTERLLHNLERELPASNLTTFREIAP